MPHRARPSWSAPQRGTGGALRARAAGAGRRPRRRALDVTFHAQARTAGPPRTATLHVHADAGHPELRQHVGDHATSWAQTQWIADNRAPLNIAFVAQLGDIVGVETSDGAVAAGVAVPGHPRRRGRAEHGAARQPRHEPHHRRRPRSTSSTSRPAGTRARRGTRRPRPTAATSGQNQFGPDPVDRQNMDNYALFSAGGMDFLLLNLEFNPPDYALDWAQARAGRLPGPPGDRRDPQLRRHRGRADHAGEPADGGNSGLDLWQKLVQPSCSIFLVVNGHFHDGDLGEARRTDTNACGSRCRRCCPTTRTGRTAATAGCGTTRSSRRTTRSARSRTRRSCSQFETDADSQFTSRTT